MAPQLPYPLTTMKAPQNTPKHPGVSELFHKYFERMRDFQIRFWVSLLLTLPILLLSPQIQEWLNLQSLSFNQDKWVLLGLGTIVFVYGGWPFFRGSIKEIRSFNLGAMTLSVLSISIVFFYSLAALTVLSSVPLFWELGIIVTLMLLGHLIELSCIRASSQSMHNMVKSLPRNVHLVGKRNEIIETPLQNIKCKDRLLIRPGELIPADGIVLEGESNVNEAKLTGETNPVYKKAGSRVITGSANIDGTITIESAATGVYSFLSQITRLVEDTPVIRSRPQQLAEKAAVTLTVSAMIIATMTFIIWKSFLNQDLAFTLQRVISVLVMVSPNTLGLVIPLVLAVCASVSASNGILIKSRHAFESAHKIQSVIFDKTGTLTEGKYGVTDIEVFHCGVNRDELIKFAASVEIRSQHPVARGIVQFSGETFNSTRFSYINGKGVSALVEGRDVKVVSPSYLQENNIRIDAFHGTHLRERGRTVVYVLINNELYGAITLSDIIRAESRTAIKSLRQMGIKTVMLTGDNRSVAKYIAEELQIDHYFAEVPHHEKVYRVKEIQNQGFLTAVTGDSISDATALAQADIGFAIGAGTDIKTKTADIVLVRNNPLDVVKAIHMSKKSRRKICHNLLWAAIYNLISLPLAAGVFYSWGIIINPALGTVLMVLNTLFIFLSSRFFRL